LYFNFKIFENNTKISAEEVKGMILIAGPASTYLAEKISEITGIKLIKLEHKLFPDGESYIRFPESVEGEDLIVIQGTHPPQDRHLVQAYLIAENALDLGAKTVSLVSPYLAYARQDKRFRKGEAISILSILRMMKSAGYAKLYTVNVHAPWIIEKSPLPLIDLRAEKSLAKYLKSLDLKNVTIVSVGKKGESMASTVAGELGVKYAAAESSRDELTGKVEVKLEGVREVKRAIIVDDIISTGGTMAELIKALKKKGAEEIYAACIHALMVGDAENKITSAGAREIIASDTIPNKFAKYSVAELISEVILRER